MKHALFAALLFLTACAPMKAGIPEEAASLPVVSVHVSPAAAPGSGGMPAPAERKVSHAHPSAMSVSEADAGITACGWAGPPCTDHARLPRWERRTFWWSLIRKTRWEN